MINARSMLVDFVALCYYVCFFCVHLTVAGIKFDAALVGCVV